MITKNKKTLAVGSCNFCQRGKLGDSGHGSLIFPYDYVYEITGESNILIRICEKCLDELKKS